MFVAFLLYLSHAIFFKEIVSLYIFFDPLYIFSSLSVYPLYYWYIKLLTVETAYKWHNLRLLAPAVIFSLTLFVLYRLMSEDERLGYIQGFLIGSKTDVSFSGIMKLQKLVYFGSRFVYAIQVIYFLVFGLKLVKSYNKQIVNFYSNLESRSIFWVNYILYSLVISSIASIIFIIIGRSFFMESDLLLLFPSLIFTVLLFFIGLLGYMQNHTVVDFEFEERENEFADSKSYNAFSLNDKILELFEKDAIYKNHDLKITQVSEMLHTNRTYISKHINTDFSCTFNDFVNKYRIEEAKRLLTDDESKNYSLNYISEKSGFGSMGSFMRVFRSVVGITPGQYRERNVVYNKVDQNKK